MNWQDQVKLDIEMLGAQQVVETIIRTCDFTDDRKISSEAKSALRWNGLAWWAVPRSLTVVRDELRLIGGVYFRSWVCELNGVRIDGHVYVNADHGFCQQCGERSQ